MSNRINEAKIINSSHFGELEITPENIFYFDNGILGFEMLNHFVLITDDEVAPFKWLISVEEPEIMFPVISPWFVEADYSPGKDIDTDQQVLFCIVTLNDGLGNITANMKAPIVLNSTELTGEQIILPYEKYNVCHIIKQHN